MTAALIVAAAVLLALAAFELYARLALGLGNPVLWMADPEMEYLARPSRVYRRLGNRIVYNAWSMRSRDFEPRRSDPREPRVLVIGDSIVNGGAHTDHDELATTILERRLGERLGRPAIVGNVAAGSWGPPNQLAYVRRFGFFDASLVVLVLNSADHADAPTFEPLDARRPQRTPVLALQEVLQKYLPGIIRRRVRGPRVRAITDEDVATCLEALRAIVRMARETGASVLAAQHLKQSEIEQEPEVGYREIARVLDELRVPRVELGPGFGAAIEAGRDPFVDGNHPNAEGQRVIADVLLDPMLEALADQAAAEGGSDSAEAGSHSSTSSG